MRENLSKIPANETLCLNGYQTMYSDDSNNQKQILFTVSSNVYYGYQPLTAVPKTAEPMHTDDLSISNDAMVTKQLEYSIVNRKRTRNHTDTTWDNNCKKRRENELQEPNHLVQKCSPSKRVLDEDLLRETHGCSYYHWIASNI